MALWKWFLQTITKTLQQQDGVGKYVYLHPWAFWSFGPSWQEFCPDVPFCGARPLVSGRLGRRGGNFVLMRPSAVHALSFLVVWAVGAGFLS